MHWYVSVVQIVCGPIWLKGQGLNRWEQILSPWKMNVILFRESGREKY